MYSYTESCIFSSTDPSQHIFFNYILPFRSLLLQILLSVYQSEYAELKKERKKERSPIIQCKINVTGTTGRPLR